MSSHSISGGASITTAPGTTPSTYNNINHGVMALMQATGYSSVNVYTPDGAPPPKTPSSSLLHSAAAHTSGGPVAGQVNIENLSPDEGSTYSLQVGAQGFVAAGTSSFLLIGQTGPELLVGNSGNDTIKGHGGTGTLIGGAGDNVFHAGRGNVAIFAGEAGEGNDTIKAYYGDNTVTVYANASVALGTGSNEFHDRGTGTTSVSVSVGSGSADLYGGAGNDLFYGGTHFTHFYSGTGHDTFIGGSGFNFMTDTGSGNTLFAINSSAAGGLDYITGFDSSRDAFQFSGYSVKDVLSNTTVMGGSSYVSLNDGTKIIVVGVDLHTVFPGQG